MATNYNFSSEIFFEELLRISSNLVWKNPTLAVAYENEEYAVNVEQYILARQGRLTFSSVFQFAEEVLRSFNLSDELIVQCLDNPFAIPEEIRDKCVQRQAEWIIDNYEEQNNYFRMLNGLPDKEDTDFLYNNDYPDISNNITPIHLLESSKLRLLEANGFLDKLYKENPKKKYLQHLTERKIDIYKARNSKDFAILWITESDSDNMVEHFIDTYNEARCMIMAVFYQRMMSQSNIEYTGFIGMMILFQTIMLMQKRFLDADITRDFYDVDSLRLVYDSYDVPFYQNIPLEYHKKIVKNINILLSHKGSTRVFYDLFDIFGFNNIAMYSFYMIKKRRLGNNCKPIIVKDEDGNPDRRKMYDIDFAKVPLYGDPLLEIKNPRNQIRYSELVSSDKYWINDKDLFDKIFNEEFNYMESKYIGIQMTTNLMQIVYETTYYLKLILDNRDMLVSTTIYNSSLHSNINIFDMVIYLCALMTKKYGFEGNIPRDPHEIGAVMGFNFKVDLEVLVKNAKKDPYLKKDKRLYTLLETMNVHNLASVKKVYTNLTALRKYLVKKMSETDNVDEYWAYYELHKTLMYSEYTEETFTKTNGEAATSFADMLADINPSLYSRYQSLEDTELNTEIVSMLYLAKSSCNSLKYIQYADSVNIDTIIEYLFKLLDFFKSAKADLTGYEVIYSLISDADNIIKLMNYVDRIYDDYTEQPLYTIFDELTDMIAWVKDRMNLRDKYKLIDEMPYQFDTTVVKSIIEYLDDYITKCMEVVYDLVDSTQMIDYLQDVREISILDDDPLTIKDQLFIMYEDIREILKFRVFDEYPILDDLISCMDRYCKQPLEDKFRLICKIACIYEAQQIGKSSYTMTDDIVHLPSKIYLESEHMLIDEIIHIYKEHTHIDTHATVEDVIACIHANISFNDMSYGLRDVTPNVREVFLIFKDFKDNYLKYKDRLIEKLTKYYFDDKFKLIDEMSLKHEIFRPTTITPYIVDYLFHSTDKSYLKDGLTIRDELFIIYIEMSEKIKLKVMDEYPLGNEIAAIYEKRYAKDVKFSLNDLIDKIKSVSFLSDQNEIETIAHIEREKDIIDILQDVKDNYFTYLSGLAMSFMRYYPKTNFIINDKISSMKETFEQISSTTHFVQDNIRKIVDKPKLQSSQIKWNDKLFLVYEEQFEDD